jgi:uncharacterized protein YeeX (DUF496 family)
MTQEDYNEAIKQKDKFVILTDNNEILKIFNTEIEAEIFSIKQMRHNYNSRIDLYKTTGLSTSKLSTEETCRDDITPVKALYVGKDW